jgi:hypothetical protein
MKLTDPEIILITIGAIVASLLLTLTFCSEASVSMGTTVYMAAIVSTLTGGVCCGILLSISDEKDAVRPSLSLEEKKALAQALFEAQGILDSKVVPLLRCGDNPYYASAMAKINRGFVDIHSTLWVKQDGGVTAEFTLEDAIAKVNNAISEANQKEKEMFENMTTEK